VLSKKVSGSSSRIKLLHQANKNLNELRNMKYSMFSTKGQSENSATVHKSKSRNSSILTRLHERLSKKQEEVELPPVPSKKAAERKSTPTKILADPISDVPLKME